MRRVWILSMAIVLVVLGAVMVAQTTSKIAVTGSEVSNGVVILQIQLAAKPHELQCNQTAGGCTNLKKGTYTMVELPKNFGMYECRDVEVYPDSVQPSGDKSSKLGEYCLTEK